MEQVTVLGATGSIGVNTLDVMARHPERFRAFALTAHSRIDVLAEQCRRLKPRYAVVANERDAGQLSDAINHRVSSAPSTTAGAMAGTTKSATKVLWGEQGLVEVAGHPDVDTVMAAIVGGAGLLPTMAAVNAGKRILLANKESLVMAGALFMQAVRSSGATLLPIDSEHNAIFQCLPAGYRSNPEAAGIRRILLSASGGPFRTLPLDQLRSVTPDQACAHPNWRMGRKISVDSATMMNKGLELLEACWLFDVAPQQVEVVIHPESIVHSLVEYIDGSVLAQLGNPDMRTPIAHALGWPVRLASGVGALDLMAAGALNFSAPEEARYPCLRLARAAAQAGKDVAIALNAANEVAVAAFLAGSIGFCRIAEVVDQVLQDWIASEPEDLAAVQASDNLARSRALVLIP